MPQQSHKRGAKPPGSPPPAGSHREAKRDARLSLRGEILLTHAVGER